ncbi:MAG: hypothetical protein A2X20_06215 [Bacteroidetes bacterium GWE2_40_15]|nr:MAG: hypothetical protein A2X20_06215 [Bacteroidetes bacterium GWE2_40_15]
MIYLQTIKNLNRSLTKRKPLSFNPAWLRNCVRKSYNFIVENIKTELDDTDWDQVVCCLDHDHQKKWMKRRKRKLNLEYEDTFEVDAILNKYHDKLYTFLTQIDNSDKKTCDEISIRLVRTAQKGNLLAKQKAVFFITQLVDCWVETRNLQHWRGYDDLIEKNIERCIRRYRYSGSFTVYLYRTLEYAGRGLRSLEAFSLDECSPITERKKADSLVYDSETGETRLFS